MNPNSLPPVPPTWSPRGPILLGAGALAVLLGGFGLWSVTTTISGAIVANGQIQVEQNRQVVQHPDGGVVEAISVTEGQAVKAGDLLLTLDGAMLKSEYSIVEGQLFELMARRARLEAERDDAAAPVMPAELVETAKARADVAELVDGQVKLFDARRDTVARSTEQLQRRSDQTREQINGIDAQVTAMATQLDLVRKELADQKALLEKGLTQASRVSELQRQEADMMGRAGELTAARAEAEQRVTEVDLEVLRLAAQRREDASTQLRDIGSQELELVERRRALSGQIERLAVRAPVSGIVLGLAVTTPRAVVRPADPLLYIIPQDRPLVIEAQIPPIHIDEVRVGQEVRLVFPAFSSRTTPELFGVVSVVSADAFNDQKTGATFYRAEIVLEAEDMVKLGDKELLPGMPVEAFIKTGDRTPMAYLLKPFTDYFQRAFRET
ncbi:HlyD family type I secretion periplasmic adaptor subunit [Gemmobacter straminiformis]|uniref:Membrane fusion protein (MFP) family protein n=2 Tax=Paragemmobacter straminiformis TaxID=2045119 RepID=A0A842I4M3_9RHOB|nr:HlyD family type I secretion periplasmic adaptor subunit [Gemmobacter straminiformis]